MRARLAPIKSLVLDRKYYPRRHLDGNLVKVYKDAMLAGAKFPPVTVATVKDQRIVLDGWHRVTAAKRAGAAHIATNDIGHLNPTEAYAEAVHSNAIHGKALDHREKMEAYRRLIREGMSIQRVSQEIVFIPPGEARKLAGKASRVGGPPPPWALRPLAPVMTVMDENRLAGAVSLRGSEGEDLIARSLRGIQLVKLTTEFISAPARIDWKNAELVAGLRSLQDAAAALKIPIEAR